MLYMQESSYFLQTFFNLNVISIHVKMDLDLEHLIYLVNSIFMFLNFIVIFFSSLLIIPKKRVFHYFLSHISITSSIAYLMLANDLLTIPLDNGKIMYNARYMDWSLNTPVQLIILGKMANLSVPNIYILAFLSVVMTLYGWLGDLTHSVFKWIFFTKGAIVMIPIYIFLFEDFNYYTVQDFSGEFIAKKYYWMGRLLLTVWSFYPIIWVLDNTGVISSLSSCIAYTASDFLSKVVFTLWIFHCVQNSNYIGETIASQEFRGEKNDDS